MTAGRTARCCSTSRWRCRANAWPKRKSGGRTLDKFEREQSGFFERVRAAYLERAAAEPERFRIVDSARPLADVRAELERMLEAL